MKSASDREISQFTYIRCRNTSIEENAIIWWQKIDFDRVDRNVGMDPVLTRFVSSGAAEGSFWRAAHFDRHGGEGA